MISAHRLFPLVFSFLLAPVATPAEVHFTVHDNAVEMAHDDHALRVSLAPASLQFDTISLTSLPSPASVTGDLAAGETLEVVYPSVPCGESSLAVMVFLHWSPAENVLRKWANFTVGGSTTPLLLKEVTLEQIELPVDANPMAGTPPQSYPAFWPGYFAGIEHPVAATRWEGGRLLLAYRPGHKLAPGARYETLRAVYGAAMAGAERTAFMDYIERHRPTPRGLHFNYNSWWTSSVPFTESEILGLMSAFNTQLFEPHHVALDTFTIDMGWSQARSLWDIDPMLFPTGFMGIQQAAEDMNAQLGLWVSPSAFYPQALDTAWAKENGYEIIALPSGARVCCLGGPKYSDVFRDRLVEMVTRFGVRHIKLDGYALQCEETDHGHLPGELSPMAVAEGGIRAFAAVRAAAPDTWLEATCFGWNPSPWWLIHVNSVIGTFGDDAPHGRVPCPVYRESYTTARDFFNLQGAAWLPIPSVAQEVLGVIHQSQEPFLNDAVTTLLRGHAFVPLYINPKYMDTGRWQQLADLMQWARAHEDILAQTQVLLPVSWANDKAPQFVNDAPMPREPYGYAHWKNGRGLVLLRNPWIMPAVINVPLNGGPQQTAYSAVSLYPEPRCYARNLPASELEVLLAPYETLLLSISTDPAPDSLPDAREAVCAHMDVANNSPELLHVDYQHEGPTLGPDWTCLTKDPFQAARLKTTAEVTVRAPQAQLLVLLEGNETPAPPRAELEIDGTARELAFVSSDAGFAASTIPGSEHWAYYGAPLSQGTRKITLSVEAGADCSRLSAWILASKPGLRVGVTDQMDEMDELDQEPETSALPTPNSELTTQNSLIALPSPEAIWLDAKPLLACVDVAEIQQSAHEPAPVERINGIFLDAMEPESATQGWGILERNRSVWEKPLCVGGQCYERGLGTHAPARIVYPLRGGYKRFQALAGQDSATNGSITFEAWADGKKLWESPRMTRDSAPAYLDIDLTNAQRLELIVGDGGDNIMGDHADWVRARLLH